MTFEPTLASVRSHRVPSWFEDAKFGIFIHWTPASVPGWAPMPGEMDKVVAEHGWSYWFANNPYTEWYFNSIRIYGSPAQQYHRSTFGADYPYERFVGQFVQAANAWDPALWANAFAAAGARYVVLVTKHHDGFLLWPSRHPNPHREGYQSHRDLVGELAAAVRARGMRFGTYYSGGLDVTFEPHVMRSFVDMLEAIPSDPAYAAYADAHWRELIERYQPCVLWNDIGYPAESDLPRLFADYYNAVPEGVINDRFAQFRLGRSGTRRYRMTVAAIRLVAPLVLKLASASGTGNGGAHADFTTPEYTSAKKIRYKKWEACRGMGSSFGYNRQETDASMIATDVLLRSFIDMVSKNGNLLLNVGPMPDGTIPDPQLRRLRAMGDWLGSNGEAIYGARPWLRAEGVTPDGIPIRFTRRDDTLYAIFLGTPRPGWLRIPDLGLAEPVTARLVHGAALQSRVEARDLLVDLPELPPSPAHAVAISPLKPADHG